jgi:hypothetical protein
VNPVNRKIMIRYLAESQSFKVYSIYESVFLKNKLLSTKMQEYDVNDKDVAWHYGDPSGALILPDENFVIVAGCGLSVYDLQSQSEKHILDAPKRIWWTNGLHQAGEDDQTKEVRFVSYNAQSQLRVFKLNVESLVITEIE